MPCCSTAGPVTVLNVRSIPRMVGLILKVGFGIFLGKNSTVDLVGEGDVPSVFWVDMEEEAATDFFVNHVT